MRGIEVLDSRSLFGMADMLRGLSMLRSAPGPRDVRRSRTTTYFPATNGTRECARRLRQIEAGRLRSNNGLAQS